MDVTFVSGNPEVVNYTASGAVAAGDVVVDNELALFAVKDIAASDFGCLAHSGGVWRGVKSTSEAIDGDTDLYWDSSNGVFTATSGSNTFVGYSVPDGAATAAETVDFVKQNISQ